MYDLCIKPYADKTFKKMEKKEKHILLEINNKINEILNEPDHEYKFLHKPLQNFNRVHINKSFVLIFKILPNEKCVEIWAYEHHYEVYKGKWIGQE